METQVERKGKIFNIQKYSIYDGYGIRTLIFLKGCNMTCDWCSNPEGLKSDFQIMYSQDKCTDCGKCAEVCPAGIFYMLPDENGKSRHHVDRTLTCNGCNKCVESCLYDAISVVGQRMTVQETMDVIMQDYDFYQSSGGGVTLGGGEMSLQTDFAVDLLKACKNMMINTAVETNGSTHMSNYERLAPYTDLFLYDIKHIDSQAHEEILGIGNEGILRNLERLVDLNANIVVRMPILKGVNDSYSAITGAIEYVANLAKKGNISHIEFLPYHQFGRNKYEKLGMIYPVKEDPSYTPEELDKMAAFFDSFDFDIRLVKH